MNLTTDNFKLTGARLYKNPVFLDTEFEKDLSLIKRIAGKIEKFSECGKFPSRLVFNNFVIACNCFGSDFVVRGLYLLSSKENHDLIMTFLYVAAGKKDPVKINNGLNVDFDINQINKGLSRKIVEDLNT